MKRVAIIAPCILPVPATRGGAVETLLTRVIDSNEISSEYDIDLFTVNAASLRDYSYNHTFIFPISTTKIQRVSDKLLDKAYRTFGTSRGARRLLDDFIIEALKSRFLELQSKGEAYEAIVVENLMSTARAVLELRKIGLDCPIYFHMHNNIDIYRSPADTRFLAENGVEFIAVSESIKKQFLEIDSGSRVETLYNGIDLEEFNIEKFPTSDKNVTEFLYIGRVIPEKGVFELVKSYINFINEALDNKLSTRLRIVGFSETLTSYEKKIRAICRGYEDFISLENKVEASRVPEVMAESDVVVMPTLGVEPFGLVALEAMALGRPLIVTDAGGVNEVVDDSCALIISQNDLETNLSIAYKKLLSKELRERFAENGRKRAREIKEYNIENYGKGFFDIIRPEAPSGKISVIIPVYNIEAYVKDCIDSVLRQTYDNLEIILINDGSTDSSGQICDDYAAKDSRIKVVHQLNQGLSAARNAGLKVATGDYIYFLDGDDRIESETLERMLVKLKAERADIVAAGVRKMFTTDDTTEIFTSQIPGSFSGKRAVVESLTNNNICTLACGKLYKRDLFEGVDFPIGMYHEDEATTYKVIARASKVSYMPDCLYNYVIRGGSIMSGNIAKRNHDYVDIAKDRIDYFRNNSDELYRISLLVGLDHIKYCYRIAESLEDRKRMVRAYRDLVKKEGYPTSIGIKKGLSLRIWKYIHF